MFEQKWTPQTANNLEEYTNSEYHGLALLILHTPKLVYVNKVVPLKSNAEISEKNWISDTY